MLDIEDFVPILVAIVVAIALFFGLRTVLKKVAHVPTPKSTVEKDRVIKEQRWRMQDVRDRQKQLIQDQKQKMRDMQRW